MNQSAVFTQQIQQIQQIVNLFIANIMPSIFHALYLLNIYLFSFRLIFLQIYIYLNLFFFVVALHLPYFRVNKTESHNVNIMQIHHTHLRLMGSRVAFVAISLLLSTYIYIYLCGSVYVCVCARLHRIC